jgi:hypothetical protein
MSNDTKKTTNQSQVTTLDDAAPATAAAAPQAAAPVLIKHDADLSGKRKILTIHAEGGEGGNNAVFIGLNGTGYLVPRGRPWNVPAELVGNLKCAEQTTYERNDKGELIPRSSPRFGYTAEDAPAAA